MSDSDILFPSPTFGRNADDMGLPQSKNLISGETRGDCIIAHEVSDYKANNNNRIVDKMVQQMSDKCAMPISKALDFADEWTLGTTFYPGSEGWRVVCKTLAAEVRRVRQGGGELPMSREQIEKEIGKCFQIGRAAHSTRENMIIFAEHILRIGTTGLREENKRLRGDNIECHQGRDIISSLSDAINTLPACGMLTIVGAAMQEIDALRSGEFICKKCGLRKDAENFFKDGVPF